MSPSQIRFVSRPECPICEHDAHQTLYEQTYDHPQMVDYLDSFYDGRLELDSVATDRYCLAQCERCGFIWQPRILNDAGMMALYEEWINPETSLNKAENRGLNTHQMHARHQWRLAASFPQLRPAQIRVLDYGCGWGTWLLMAKANGFDATGLELSEKRIAYGRRHGLNMVPVLEDGQQFHIVYANQVLEHVPDPRATMASLAAHTQTGGTVCISVPNSDGVVPEIRARGGQPRRALMPVQPLEHINSFTHATLARLGEQVGLTLMPVSRWRRRIAAILPVPTTKIPRLGGLTLYFHKCEG